MPGELNRLALLCGPVSQRAVLALAYPEVLGKVLLGQPLLLGEGQELADTLKALYSVTSGAGAHGTLAELAAADVRFVDGTFYTADELQAMRPGAPDAFAMGHLPITGRGGSLIDLAELTGRSLYFHMNGTNPVLDLRSPERKHVEACGVEIAEDGMEFSL